MWYRCSLSVASAIASKTINLWAITFTQISFYCFFVGVRAFCKMVVTNVNQLTTHFTLGTVSSGPKPLRWTSFHTWTASWCISAAVLDQSGLWPIATLDVVWFNYCYVWTLPPMCVLSWLHPALYKRISTILEKPLSQHWSQMWYHSVLNNRIPSCSVPIVSDLILSVWSSFTLHHLE